LSRLALAATQNFTNDTNYLIEVTPSIKFDVEICNHVAWTFDQCIIVWSYLRPILTIDVRFLLGHYVSKLFMECTYDAEQ
jgi:hypothetical protein